MGSKSGILEKEEEEKVLPCHSPHFGCSGSGSAFCCGCTPVMGTVTPIHRPAHCSTAICYSSTLCCTDDQFSDTKCLSVKVMTVVCSAEWGLAERAMER